ncbi:hypothetical protein PTSG_02611 [Salpingoeca rosetta]|uniref:PDZ domain-containing protein n=1 Tax=Salpingoeca rosetta (strain ATCC 50818 / BSB-021) TaxID=946362 RepID=F2U2T2_SALR5|nr:uncharacterized protein PTSG_02611 [Salpingoeca rosetta]EGD81926.1 hypothetical protein PTSG_02611 [Salpingoeca rosetta]|eukprot:XP_004996109.1 hypothetical protein PTSG_02611 [Salpingoeca rosetta]
MALLSVQVIVAIALGAVALVAALLLCFLLRFLKKRSGSSGQVGVLDPFNQSTQEVSFTTELGDDSIHDPEALEAGRDSSFAFGPSHAAHFYARAALRAGDGGTADAADAAPPTSGWSSEDDNLRKLKGQAWAEEAWMGQGSEAFGSSPVPREWDAPATPAVQPRPSRPSTLHRHERPPMPEIDDELFTPQLLRSIAALDAPQDEFFLVVVQAEPGLLVAQPRVLTFPAVPGFDGLGISLAGAKPVRIMTVDPESPAELGGAIVGDCILQINGQPCLDLPHQRVVQLMADELNLMRTVTVNDTDDIEEIDMDIDLQLDDVDDTTTNTTHRGRGRSGGAPVDEQTQEWVKALPKRTDVTNLHTRAFEMQALASELLTNGEYARAERLLNQAMGVLTQLEEKQSQSRQQKQQQQQPQRQQQTVALALSARRVRADLASAPTSSPLRPTPHRTAPPPPTRPLHTRASTKRMSRMDSAKKQLLKMDSSSISSSTTSPSKPLSKTPSKGRTKGHAKGRTSSPPSAAFSTTAYTTTRGSSATTRGQATRAAARLLESPTMGIPFPGLVLLDSEQQQQSQQHEQQQHASPLRPRAVGVGLPSPRRRIVSLADVPLSPRKHTHAHAHGGDEQPQQRGQQQQQKVQKGHKGHDHSHNGNHHRPRHQRRMDVFRNAHPHVRTERALNKDAAPGGEMFRPIRTVPVSSFGGGHHHHHHHHHSRPSTVTPRPPATLRRGRPTTQTPTAPAGARVSSLEFVRRASSRFVVLLPGHHTGGTDTDVLEHDTTLHHNDGHGHGGHGGHGGDDGSRGDSGTSSGGSMHGAATADAGSGGGYGDVRKGAAALAAIHKPTAVLPKPTTHHHHQHHDNNNKSNRNNKSNSNADGSNNSSNHTTTTTTAAAAAAITLTPARGGVSRRASMRDELKQQQKRLDAWMAEDPGNIV